MIPLHLDVGFLGILLSVVAMVVFIFNPENLFVDRGGTLFNVFYLFDRSLDIGHERLMKAPRRKQWGI